MAIGPTYGETVTHYGTGYLYNCTCQGPWGIGLPFDHPIWQSILDHCPAHGTRPATVTDQTISVCLHDWRGKHLEDPVCGKCGIRESEGGWPYSVSFDNNTYLTEGQL